MVDYAVGQLSEENQPDFSTIESRIQSDTKTWLRITGIPNSEWIRQLGTLIGLHPLAQEDILNGGQRSKLEPYDDQLFVVMNIPAVDQQTLTVEPLYIIWHQQYVVTFFNGNNDPFENLLKRIRTPGAGLRGRGLDYLIYALLDMAVDTSFPVLETLGLQLEALEERMMAMPDTSVLQEIHALKRQIIIIRRAIWPQREVINQLLRDEDQWITEPVQVYLRDCYDHTVQIMDLVESYRDTGASLHDLYLSSASMRMNDVMRVLTIIATIFIPLTFLAGVYGMNFASESSSSLAMPELRWRWSYPALWGIFIATAAGMLIWFRKKRWI